MAASTIRSRLVRFLAAAFIAFVCASAPAVAIAGGADEESLDEAERAMLEAINGYRTRLGLPTLVAVPILNVAAARHSADMIRRGYFGHVDPDGASPFDRMAAVGYDADNEGETLASGHEDAASTLRQWQRSPPHDRALRDPSYRAIGIGRVYTPRSRYRYFWTAVFGDVVPPIAAPAGFVVESRVDEISVQPASSPPTARRPLRRSGRRPSAPRSRQR